MFSFHQFEGYLCREVGYVKGTIRSGMDIPVRVSVRFVFDLKMDRYGNHM